MANKIRYIYVVNPEDCSLATVIPVDDYDKENCGCWGSPCGGCTQCLEAQARHYGYTLFHLDENGDFCYDNK